MKTCGQCRHLLFNRCLLKKREGLSTDSEACAFFELELYVLDKVVEKSIAKARAKHPDFCPFAIHRKNHIEALARLHEAEPDEHFFTLSGNIDLHHLDNAREAVRQCPSVLNVLKCEVVEFCKELELGDFDRALEEAGDVIAVLYRAINGEGKGEAR